jgi:phenylalanyl-tRNA synthetase beta chain
MKFSVEWLQDLANSKLKPKELAELLSEHTAEAEVNHAQSFKNIIIAEVTKVEKHPNADRLRVIELTDGKNDYKPVVCGAWNFDVGARVALALPGATIPHNQHDPEGKPFTLGKASIRGIESQGMICSGKELGLSGDGQGIMLLDASHKLGQELSIGDEILDVSSFANRPDLYSYLGVAREIAALTGSIRRMNLPDAAKLPKAGRKFPVEIKNSKHCGHYTGVVLKNVSVGPSPDFIQKRLKSSGLRPINNVVDITNYVMLLAGQPMHAFDASKVDSQIIVRNAEPGEKIQTLDGTQRTLTKDILVVADSSRALAVAGIIGGQESAVSSTTTDIILEAANFDAVSVRKSARNLNIRTDASTRFEKSLPIAFVDPALEFALALLKRYANATVVTLSQAGRQPEKQKAIPFTARQVNGLLGINLPAAEQKSILEKFGVTVTGTNAMKGLPPAWRPDMSIWEDLAEEISRHVGVNSIAAIPPSNIFSSHMTDPMVDFRERLADMLVSYGLSETYTYSFTPEGSQSALEIANPLNDEQKYMRTSILVNMVHVAELNSRYFEMGNYFETGNIYRKSGGGHVEIAKLGLLSYAKGDYPVQSVTDVIAGLAEKMGCELEIIQHADSAADILMDGKAVGVIETLPHADLKMVGASLDLRHMLQLSHQKQFHPISRFPHKSLDTSLLLDEKTAWSEILKAAGKDPILGRLELVDVYQGSGIPSGKKSLTIRGIYLAPDRTLTDQEAVFAHDQIMKKIAQKTGGSIRE